VIRLVLLLLVIAGPAAAHGETADSAPDWEWDFWVVAPLLISALLYIAGVRLQWLRSRSDRAIRWWQVTCFGLGLLTAFGALCSPLHWYSEHLFSAHMLEHELLMAVAAPLLSVSKPIGAFLRAFPKNWRLGVLHFAHSRPVKRVWAVVVDPTFATVLHAVALWAWHAPVLFEAAVRNEAVHRLQHLSFFASALIFWWALLRRPVREQGSSALHVFVTMSHMTLLGGLLALAPHVLYPMQTIAAGQFGLTPLEDQQLGGLIMWVPAGTIYAAIALAMSAVWIARAGSRSARSRQTIL
jgi:cytochrome c oxidase assembly factor CtaG